VNIKPVFKPENSLLAGFATIGLVAGVYALDAGPVSQVHFSGAKVNANSTSIQKAGYTSLVMVAGITLLARDPNILILGGAAIIAFHSHYRHADMVRGARALHSGGPGHAPGRRGLMSWRPRSAAWPWPASWPEACSCTRA
jgi:hypothetical protein